MVQGVLGSRAHNTKVRSVCAVFIFFVFLGGGGGDRVVFFVFFIFFVVYTSPHVFLFYFIGIPSFLKYSFSKWRVSFFSFHLPRVHVSISCTLWMQYIWSIVAIGLWLIQCFSCLVQQLLTVCCPGCDSLWIMTMPGLLGGQSMYDNQSYQSYQRARSQYVDSVVTPSR